MEAFWTTEYGQNLLSVEQTEIDKLLSSPNTTTLEDLFDEDELLQQCSNKNTQLINFLSKQENITKLVSYITRPWQEHMTAIINNLKQRQIEEKEQSKDTNTNTNESNDPNTDTSECPLSQNGANRIGSIEEEPIPIQGTIDTPPDSTEDKPEDISTQNIEQTETTQTSDTQTQTNDLNEETNETKENTASDNTETNVTKDSNDSNEAIDEFNDTNYDNLRLSDSGSDGDNDTQIETDIVSPSDGPPKLKKKGSIVDMLMDGPSFEDDTELELDPDQTDTNDNDNDDTAHDGDPELPDFDVKNDTETAKDSLTKPVLTYNSGSDDIPPPPPPPTQPSKLEEFKTEIGIEKVKLKYPYLASEIINCQIPQILDIILSPQNPFLDMLFDFIQQSPPLNAVLTNYWRSCIVGLVRRNSVTVLSYIKSRANLLASLVSHIRDQSIMELVIALGWDPAIEELKELDEVADWMYSQALVPKLISTLSPQRTPDEHSAASYTLVDIVAKTSRSTNLVLFYNLASEKQIDALMNHMFAGNRSSLLESLSVLLALLHHYPNVSAEKQQFGEEDIAENDVPPPPDMPKVETEKLTVNPLAPKQSKEPTAESGDMDSQVKTEVENENQNETETAQDSQEISENIPTAQVEDEVKFEDGVPSVVKAVCLRLGEFKVLLEDDNLPDLALPFVHLAPPLGPVRHKVVDMIVALMRTPSAVVSEKLRSLGLIVKCIDLFFLYPWNNLLHGSVEHIIQMVVSGECSILKAALFEDCDFLNRILKARELSTQHQEKSGFRLGYMGHITRVSNTIVEFAKRNKQLLEYMQTNTDWMKFIADDLKLENEQLNTQLGGHRPSALSGDDDVDDFTLFTLNDITNHNEDDPDQILGDGNEDDDEDSDSDSDEDMNRDSAQQELVNETGINYELPQDQFKKLTAEMDETNEEQKQENSDDFDTWLNDDENWQDFGEDETINATNVPEINMNKAKPVLNSEINGDASVNKKEELGDSKNDNDFENWDNDPFADDNDDLFGNDKEKDTSEKPVSTTEEILKDTNIKSDAMDELDKLGHMNNKMEKQTEIVVNE